MQHPTNEQERHPLQHLWRRNQPCSKCSRSCCQLRNSEFNKSSSNKIDSNQIPVKRHHEMYCSIEERTIFNVSLKLSEYISNKPMDGTLTSMKWDWYLTNVAHFTFLQKASETHLWELLIFWNAVRKGCFCFYHRASPHDFYVIYWQIQAFTAKDFVETSAPTTILLLWVL